MDRINYPLIYFDLNEELVLGILVGTQLKMIESDVKKIKGIFLEHLRRDYRRYDFYPYFDIEHPKMKVITVSIRPAFTDHSTSYPLGYELEVPVPVIYGEVEADYFECYLPLLGQSFNYYDANQFDSLVHHFATASLNNLSPEKLFKFMQYPPPKLENVSLRVNKNRQYYMQNNFKREFPRLARLAEQYPYPKSVRRNISALPDAAWELEDKVAEVIDKLASSKANVILVGDHGVGKSAVLQQAIKKMALHYKKNKIDISFWRIMPQRITASAKYLGEWEETVEGMIEELDLANGILWVVDLARLLEIGGTGPEDSVAAFLQPYLRQSNLQIVGESTPEQLESMRRLLPGFVENFQLVHIEELSAVKIQSVLQHFNTYVNQKYKLDISEDAQLTAYRLLRRYYPYESFPGKGISFLSRCLNEVLHKEGNKIDREVIIENFVNQTGLPDLLLKDDELLDIEDLHNYFNNKIIGQRFAVDKLCEIVKIFKAGLNNPNKPITTMLFAGPTGVGKTASAKALANYFFGKGQRKFPLVRIDMSEFQHPIQIARLIGDGREIGQLVKEVREKPFSVLLLDEVEKAHPSIFDVLLSVLDEGILVDRYGRKTNFRNTIIIMTSNLGASNQKSIGFQQTTSAQDKYLSAIERHFRPEFVNRIDSIVLFNALLSKDIEQIAEKELEELKKREGFVKRKLNLQFSTAIKKHIAKIGFDEDYGARPLQRAIEQTLVNPLATWLLDNAEVNNRKVYIDYNGQLSINV
ncbi:MAG: AAA family ATPase [Bacteroidota bacterium]